MITINTVYSLFPGLRDVSNKEWADGACKVWLDLFKESKWCSVNDVPFTIKSDSGTLVAHTQATIKAACRIADDMMKVYPIHLNKDWIILASVLHDVSKIAEYKMNPDGSYGRTEAGKMYQHGFLGAHYAALAGIPEEVISIIMCHTPQSNVKMSFLEGVIVMHAEGGVAAAHVDYVKQMEDALNG